MIELESLKKFIDTAKAGERIRLFKGGNYSYLIQSSENYKLYRLITSLHDDYGWHFFQVKHSKGSYEYILERGIGHKPRWRSVLPCLRVVK
jgi:hypothetical protein